MYQLFEIIDNFRFKLARELNKSLGEIDEMQLSEFLEWYEYAKKEPFGVERSEFMMAQITALLYNTQIAKVKGSKKFLEPLDFLISVDEDIVKQVKQQRLNEDLLKAMQSMKVGKKCQ